MNQAPYFLAIYLMIHDYQAKVIVTITSKMNNTRTTAEELYPPPYPTPAPAATPMYVTPHLKECSL